MSQFKPEDVKGVVRNSDSTHTAVLKDGTRKTLDSGEAGSLLNRLDKDRSRMEREGQRAPERAPETYNEHQRALAVKRRDDEVRRELARDPRYAAQKREDRRR